MEEREREEGLRGSRRGELVIRRSGEIAIRDRDACGRLDLEEVGAGPYKEVFWAMYVETYM